MGESLGEAEALVPWGQVVLALIVSRCVLALVTPRGVPALALEGEDLGGKGRGEVPGEPGERRRGRAPVKWTCGAGRGGSPRGALSRWRRPGRQGTRGSRS